MSGSSPPKKKVKASESIDPAAKALAKGLIKQGASLQMKKAVVLANLALEDSSVFAIHRMMLGSVGGKICLAPKEWLAEGYTITYDKNCFIEALTKDGVVITGSSILSIANSWNGYQKYDAQMVIFNEDKKVIGCIPRAMHKEDVMEINVKGTKKEVKKWVTIFRKEYKTYYTDPEVLMGFLKLEMVGLKNMLEVTLAVEDAVVKGGYVQLDPGEFTNEGIASIASDSSIFSSNRNLAAILLGFALEGKDLNTKVEAFIKTPSVSLAHAAGFCQLQAQQIVNVTTQSVVEKVNLVSLADDALVLMNKVGISQNYWDSFDNIEKVECYVATDSLAVKKKGKKQTSPMRFESMEAGPLIKIHKAICASNTNLKVQAKPLNVAKEDEQIDDDFFGA